MAGPRPTTRAGSGLTIRKNSAATSVRSTRDLDLIEGDGILLTITHDRGLGTTRVTVTATTGPSADREVGITAADTTPAELDTKLVVTAPISKVIEGAGGDERLRITHGGSHNFTDLLGVLSDAQHGTRSGDLHPIYLTEAEADALYEVIGAVAIHEAAGDPHAIYLTQTEADALYEALGAVATHEAAADPHIGYQKESEKGAANGYPDLDGSTLIPVAQLGTGTPDGTKYLRDDRTWQTPAGGGGTYLTLTDTPASYVGEALKLPRVNAAENAIEFHDPYAAAHTWAALQTFGAGIKLAAAQQIKDSADTGRILLAAASPHVKVTGDLHVSGNTGERLRVGPLGPVNNNIIEATAKTPAYGDYAEVNFFKASHVGSGIHVGTWSTVRGIFGLPVVSFASGSVYGVVYGLQFTPKVVGGGGDATIAQLQALRAGYAVGAYSGIIAVATGAEIDAPAFSGVGFTITLSTGVHIGNFGNSAFIADAYSLKIDDMTINTGFRRLIEAGPATPNLRLEANAPSDPGANLGRSQLLLAFNEGGVVSLRREEWVLFQNLANGDKVRVAV